MSTNKKAPKLPLTINEKIQLKKARITLAKIATFSPIDLARLIHSSIDRCAQLIALSQFQTLISVGPSLAQDLYDLGFCDLKSLKKANPHKMFEELSALRGTAIDPCVEDVFRCAVEQMKNPNLSKELKQWWYWSNQRNEG